MLKIPLKKSWRLDRDPDPDYHLNLVDRFLNYVQPLHKISQIFDRWFFYVVLLTNRQTDTDESITSSTEVMIEY